MKLRLTVLLIFAASGAPAVYASDVPDNPRLSAGQTLSVSLENILKDLPSSMISDSKLTFSRRDNLAALLLAGGASLVMHNTDADNNVADNLDRRVFDDCSERCFYYLGSPGTHFAATGLWYMWSLGGRDELNQDRAWKMLSALSVTGLATVGLKAAVHNDTPNGENWAWPSGHTSSSFTVAAVLDEFYGPKVGIPAYVGASLVGLRMMDTGDHWASDVLFGATLGLVVGHTVAGEKPLPEIGGFRLVPCTIVTQNEPATGIGLYKSF